MWMWINYNCNCNYRLGWVVFGDWIWERERERHTVSQSLLWAGLGWPNNNFIWFRGEGKQANRKWAWFRVWYPAKYCRHAVVSVSFAPPWGLGPDSLSRGTRSLSLIFSLVFRSFSFSFSFSFFNFVTHTTATTYHISCLNKTSTICFFLFLLINKYSVYIVRFLVHYYSLSIHSCFKTLAHHIHPSIFFFTMILFHFNAADSTVNIYYLFHYNLLI